MSGLVIVLTRLAWILQNINAIPGTGIIYCLTVNDCKLVNKWLNENGIPSECYFADLKPEKKNEVVDAFINNFIKVLVATVAFGMGFDKPDISFVIHFQRPGNVVAYYQQIGRAGRGINQAYVILLCGGEDDDINKYFIESAFPTEELMGDVINTIIEYPGIKISQLEKHINMKSTKIKACIKYLMVKGDIYVENKQFYKSTRIWKPDLEKSREITEIRKSELKQMEGFAKLESCYMEYIAKVLDDPNAETCGKCENCLRHPLLSPDVSEKTVLKAQQFIREDFNIIESRKQWPSGENLDGRNRIRQELLCETGRVLSNYGDAGWGRLVMEGKYKYDFFDSQLVEASVALLENFIIENDIKWVTNIPSNRRPELKYYDVIEKVNDNKCQKELNSSYLQYKNAYSSFEVKDTYDENVLLVDDMVDSRWTFTVCGYKLRKSGCGKIFPFALTNSAGRNGDE